MFNNNSYWSDEKQHHMQINGDRPVSRIPPEAAGIVHVLKDKSASELHKLLTDKNAYQQFLLSLDMVLTQIRLRNDLRNETIQIAKHNLEKEPHIKELRNQCQIIRVTELAAAREKLNELEKQKQEILNFYSPASLLNRLQEAMRKTEDESEALHQQLLNGEIDLTTFIHKYKTLRKSYHKWGTHSSRCQYISDWLTVKLVSACFQLFMILIRLCHVYILKL